MRAITILTLEVFGGLVLQAVYTVSIQVGLMSSCLWLILPVLTTWNTMVLTPPLKCTAVLMLTHNRRLDLVEDHRLCQLNLLRSACDAYVAH